MPGSDRRLLQRPGLRPRRPPGRRADPEGHPRHPAPPSGGPPVFSSRTWSTGTDDRNGRLLAAARRGDADAVRAALEARDEELRSPLLLAALGNHVEAARVLVRAGTDPVDPAGSRVAS
ncbi:hypothetical protein ACN9MM_37665 [Streptomyces sp. E-08]